MIKQFKGNYRFLSNFWEHPVKWDGLTFSCVECLYQYLKCITQKDKDKMSQVTDPKKSKRMSKRIKVREDWDTVKEGIMEDLVRQKFQDPSLREMLMSTGTEELQEGNKWGDEFWGVSFRTGKGDNRLGKILMKIREEG